MFKGRWLAPVFLLCGALTGAPAWSQRIEIDCYGSLQSYKMTNPGLSCTCSSAHSSPSCGGGSSHRSSQGKYPSAKAQAAATIAGSLVGALLGSLFEEEPSPSPAEIEQARLQAEALRQAEVARAKAEEARHQKLLGSLISTPGRGAAGTGRSGIRLTALQPASVTTTLAYQDAPASPLSFGSDEEARAWMANSETLFVSVWKPLAVGAPLPLKPPSALACRVAAQGCEIVLNPGGVAPLTGVAPLPPRQLAAAPDPAMLRHTVALLRPSSCVGRCDDLPYDLRTISGGGFSAQQLRQSKLVTSIDLLNNYGKVLIESMVLSLTEVLPYKKIAEVGVLYYKVANTADTGLTDAIKAMGYLGSGDPNASLAPVTSSEEAAEPYAGDTQGVSKLVIETASLMRTFGRLWLEQQ